MKIVNKLSWLVSAFLIVIFVSTFQAKAAEITVNGAQYVQQNESVESNDQGVSINFSFNF
ncbi:UNVERIFIED_CONTAM: hypothetical protein RF648_20715 [Kocuria sp. CPCC 205274]|uniref:Secreted protein n=1 Tax=Herbiconiux daphne TaxID=2970914 RepID=A0ABT2HCH2_9MICO|nr:hypothetical protein [Herbiconiux daphne]MCS5737604.1 hypothetical protein [Herbiconiux daphne]